MSKILWISLALGVATMATGTPASAQAGPPGSQTLHRSSQERSGPYDQLHNRLYNVAPLAAPSDDAWRANSGGVG